MKKGNKKGFTLIELLAVIVILAIIALIATPIVMNLINKARKSAAEDSAYGMVKAAESYYAGTLLETSGNGISSDLEFSCTKDGCKIGEDKELTFNGTKPSSGTITIKPDGKVQIADLIINNYKCNYKENSTEIECLSSGQTTTTTAATPVVIPVISNVTVENTNNKAEISISFEEGKVGSKTVCEYGISEGNYTKKVEAIDNKCIIKNLTPKTTYYYKVVSSNNGSNSETKNGSFRTHSYLAIAYFNPANLEKCTEEEAEANLNSGGEKKEVKTGCMRWYAYKDNGDTYDMILDHNTTATVQWAVGGGSTMKEASQALINDTSTWNSSLNARIWSANDVAKVVGVDVAIKWDSSKKWEAEDIIDGTDIDLDNAYDTRVSWIYLDGEGTTYAGWNTTKNYENAVNDYFWLFDNTRYCKQYGCMKELSESTLINGYWTSSSVFTEPSNAYHVTYAGKIDSSAKHYEYLEPKYGIRPVITVSKSLAS